MKFWEAMKALEDGKRVRCKAWDERKATIPYWTKYSQGGSSHVDDVQWSDCEYRVHLMMKEEWEIYEDPAPVFNLFNLLPKLRHGTHFRRKSWPDYIESLYFSAGGQINNVIDYAKYSLSFDDLVADDWMVSK